MLLAQLHLTLPVWVHDLDLGRGFAGDEDKVALAIELSRLNIEARSGGPFGAVVFDADDRVVAIGVNRVLPEPVEPDRSCRSDADCTVKNVGNCCGEYPACVNKDSPADPGAVQAQCAQQGVTSTCGFRQISGCRCVDGSCIALLQAIDPPVDPAPQPPEER